MHCRHPCIWTPAGSCVWSHARGHPVKMSLTTPLQHSVVGVGCRQLPQLLILIEPKVHSHLPSALSHTASHALTLEVFFATMHP